MNVETLLTKTNTTLLTPDEITALRARGDLSNTLFEAAQTQDFTPFFEALKAHFQIDTIADDVQTFIKATVLVKKVVGSACLSGVSEYIDIKLSRMEDYLENFPALYVHSDVWVMLTNAKVITLHHDATFDELAMEIEDVAKDRDDFLTKFSHEGSFLDLRELLHINYLLEQKGLKCCWTTANEVDESKKLLSAIKEAKNLSYAQLAELTQHNEGSGYLYEIAMEFFDLLEDGEATIEEVDEG